MSIGVFDSGIGGLTVLDALKKRLPRESFVYFGDTANVPYGDKSETEVCDLAVEAVRFLEKQGVKAIVIACHTVSACAFSRLQSHAKVPLFEIISAGVQEVVSHVPLKCVAVMATKRTVESSVYRMRIAKELKGVHVVQVPCPRLVPLIEKGVDASDVIPILREDLDVVIENHCDVLLLGCTHFPYLIDAFKACIDVPILSPEMRFADMVAQGLANFNLEADAALTQRCFQFFSKPIQCKWR